MTKLLRDAQAMQADVEKQNKEATKKVELNKHRDWIEEYEKEEMKIHGNVSAAKDYK